MFRGINLLCGLVYLSSLTSCGSTNFGSSNERTSPQKKEPADSGAKPVASPSPIPAIAPANDVYLGGMDQLFHLGDGNMSEDSDCYSEVLQHSLTGTKFTFEFELMADSPQVQIAIEKICGVDRSNNQLYLESNGSKLVDKMLKPNDKTALEILGQGTALKKGKYKLVIQSASMVAGFEGVVDFDDFIVGQIHIKSQNAQIVQGQILSE